MSSINELKLKIESRSLSNEPQIWVMSDYSSYIIAEQYINEIAKYKNLEVKYISSYKEIAPAGFVEDSNLYIFKQDKLTDFKPYNNLIIICNKSDYKEAIKFPKLEHWQFVDYLSNKAKGLNKVELEWLITQYEQTDSRVTETNYRRLENDIDKIAIFNESVQPKIYNELLESGEFDTISNLTMFDLTNAIVARNSDDALKVLKVADYIDIKPHVWALTILLKSFRNILAIQCGNNTKAEDLGISDKQFFVMKKYNCGHYTNEELFKIYNILTNAEYMFKFGGLSQDMLLDYLVINILGV